MNIFFSFETGIITSVQASSEKNMTFSTQMVYLAQGTAQQLRDVHPVPAQCWPSVCDAGPPLNRRWANVLCLSQLSNAYQRLWFSLPVIAGQISTGQLWLEAWEMRGNVIRIYAGPER